MNESEKQFSFTRAALSTGGRAESKFLSLISPDHSKDSHYTTYPKINL
jgi:hypothetical protein